MATFMRDEDGDSLRIVKVHGTNDVRLMTFEQDSEGVTVYAAFGRIDADELIAAIKQEVNSDARSPYEGEVLDSPATEQETDKEKASREAREAGAELGRTMRAAIDAFRKEFNKP